MHMFKRAIVAAAAIVAASLVAPTHAVASDTDPAPEAGNCVTSIAAPQLSPDGTLLSSAYTNCAGTIRIVYDHPILPDITLASKNFAANYDDPYRFVTRTCATGGSASGWVYTEVITNRFSRSPSTYIPYCGY